MFVIEILLDAVLGQLVLGWGYGYILYGMMLVHLVWYHISDEASHILIGACTAIMLLSAVLYGIRNMKILLEKPQTEI